MRCLRPIIIASASALFLGAFCVTPNTSGQTSHVNQCFTWNNACSGCVSWAGVYVQAGDNFFYVCQKITNNNSTCTTKSSVLCFQLSGNFTRYNDSDCSDAQGTSTDLTVYKPGYDYTNGNDTACPKN